MVLAALLSGCSGSPDEGETPVPEQRSEDPQPETRNPEAPPFGAPRPKIRPNDVAEEEED
jgi:hypothetical protein